MKIGYLLVGGKYVTGIPSVQNNLLPELMKIDPSIEMYTLTNNDFNLPIKEPHRVFSEMRISNFFKLIDFQYDLIHSFQPPFDFLESNAKKILTIHDLSPMLFPDWYNGEEGRKRFDVNIRNSAKMADAIITVSEYTKTDVVKYFNIDPKKITVIYNGLSKNISSTLKAFDENTDIRNKYSIHGDYILSVCTLMINKNLSGVIAAYKLFREKNKDCDLKLVLTGAESNDGKYKEILNTLGPLRKDVIMTGFVDDFDLLALYKNAFAFTYCSFYEGFGLPVLEAMALGKAVICSNTSSIPEVGGNAVAYCDPNRIESIEFAIEKCVLDTNYRKELETKAIKQASKFSYEKAAQELYKVYKNVLGE